MREIPSERPLPPYRLKAWIPTLTMQPDAAIFSHNQFSLLPHNEGIAFSPDDAFLVRRAIIPFSIGLLSFTILAFENLA